MLKNSGSALAGLALAGWSASAGADDKQPAAAKPPEAKPSAKPTPAQSKPAPAGTPDGYIDAHVHVWTPDVRKYPLASGFTPAEMKPPSFTPAELFAHARPCGVARVVLIQMSFYKYDNSYMLDAIAEHPGVFSGVAIVDHEKPNVADTMRDLAKKGVRGFRLAPSAPPESYFTSAGMETMWKTGAEQNLKMCLLINPNALPTIDKLCEKFPDAPVVIDHFARIGVNGQIVDSELAQLCRLARHKNTFVKVSAFYALGKKMAPYLDLQPMIRLLHETYGPQRLMWASDCPFQVQNGHTYRDSIDLVLKRIEFLTADDRKHLLGKTAERVFFT